MSKRDWKAEYERTLKEQQQAAAARRRAASRKSEQRRGPRLQPRGVSVAIGFAPGVHLIDLDDTTVEFYAERRFEPGAQVLVQVDTAPPMRTEVVSCLVQETDPMLLEVRYRVRCRIDPHREDIPSAR